MVDGLILEENEDGQEVTEEQEKVEIPENWVDGSVETFYCDDDKLNELRVSNSWSRKSLQKLYGQDDDSLYWCVMNKCSFVLMNEFQIAINRENMTEEKFEEIPFHTIHWITETLINHTNFLVDQLLIKRKER